MSKKQSERKKLIGKLDNIFSKFIRLRDCGNGGRCISCGKMITFNTSDCGHFFSRRYYSVRWHEDNCHAQCRQCNRFEEGNKYYYGKKLEIKIGLERLKRIELLKNSPMKFSEIDLKLLIEKYTKKVNEYK